MATTDVLSLLCFLGSIILIGLVFLATSIRIVKKGTRLSVYRLGRYIGDKGPGIVILIPIIDRAVKLTFEMDKELLWLVSLPLAHLHLRQVQVSLGDFVRGWMGESTRQASC